ncbi:MAG: hypothetical protein IJE78_05915 [Bacteroidaceae bacterium]|nr:hypothetical protein [Bacteroidaceae bacterium]
MNDTTNIKTFKTVIGAVGVDRNGRMISEETWRKALESMGDHVLGTFMNDDYTSTLNYEPNIMNSCTELRSYEICEDGCVYVDFEIIDTPYGKLLNRLLDSEPGLRVHAKPIAIGTIEEDAITDFSILGFNLELISNPNDQEGEN